MSGSMELFYIPNVTTDLVVLENEQFKHAVKALRKSQGDTIQFTDGKGVIYEGTIQDIERRTAAIYIQHRREAVRPEYHVRICVSLTKNIKRIEWALEKITEMGISRITPVICHRSERTTFNRDRLTKILISAMKQSQQAFLPILDDPMAFGDLIASFDLNRNMRTDNSDNSYNSDHNDQRGDHSDNSDQSDKNTPTFHQNDNLQRYIAHKSDTSISLKDNYTRGSDVVILVGPEGDFTDEELELAGKANFTALSLGHNRLRTETAAVVAVASVHAMN